MAVVVVVVVVVVVPSLWCLSPYFALPERKNRTPYESYVPGMNDSYFY